MPAIVDYPELVHQQLAQYGDLFANEPERRHFAEYLTGLYVAERKNVSGINREFAVTTDQSCLNRWLTQVDWDVSTLNERRLALLQKDSSTRWTAWGSIPLDNTLIDHARRASSTPWSFAASASAKPAGPSTHRLPRTPTGPKNWSTG